MSAIHLHPDGSLRFRNRMVARGRPFPSAYDTDAFAEIASAAHRRSPDRRHAPRAARPPADHRRRPPRLFERASRSDEGLFAPFSSFIPNTMKRVSFLQIAPPTREDVEAYADDPRGAGIAVQAPSTDASPISTGHRSANIHRSVPRDKLAALYRVSRGRFSSRPFARRHEPRRQGICRGPEPG